jgi:tRNA dimethylallyltransferase
VKDAAEPGLVCVMGPTGAGKTALALALAARFPVEIVSVDSALVFRGLDVGAAKPPAPVLARVPHHLVDICDPAEAYSAARFRQDALAAIAAIRSRGRIPLLVGGTGLYFRALERGLSALPESDPAVRAGLERERAALGLAALHERLQRVDPQSAARIHPNDPQRILRALEIHALSGRSRSEWFAAAPGPSLNLIKFAVAPPQRARLHAAIAARFYSMLEQGLMNEVLMLRRRGDLGLHCPAVRAVGYQQAWRHLDGEFGHAEMIERAIAATRQLAKRQFTWFRGDADVVWLEAGSQATVDCVAVALEAQHKVSKRDYNGPVNESRLDG